MRWYKGYKLHLISSSDSIPITFNFTAANVYDSNCKDLINELDFIILGDAAYDSVKLFKLCDKHAIKKNLFIYKLNMNKYVEQHESSPLGGKIMSIYIWIVKCGKET